jgi:hypothetical protein
MDFDWHEEWEKAAADEYQYYNLATDKQLENELQNQAFGCYYRIWDVIRDRGNPQLIWPLFGALKKLKGTAYFHDRHHCVDAIFHLTGIKNNSLRRRIVGPSTEFIEEQFWSAIGELEQKVVGKLPKIH